MQLFKEYAAVNLDRRIALLLLVPTMLCVRPCWSAEPQQTLTPVPERAAAAEVALESVDGATVRLIDLRGKVVVVNFWATWCPPCRREMPSLERLNKLMQGEPFAIVGIDAGEEAEDVLSFRASLKPAPTFQLLLDKDGAALKAYGVRGLPATFVIDRQGRIAYKALGARKFDDPGIVAAIRALIAAR